MGCWSELHGLDGLLNQAENIVLPWVRKYGWTDFYVLFCLAALIFRHLQNFYFGICIFRHLQNSRGLVFPDRLDTLDRRPGPKSLRRAGLSGRFWIWVSSAAGGAHLFLWISWHQLALFARGFVYMYENLCLIRYMRNSIGFLKIKETDFVGRTHQSKCQFLFLGRFGEATKISILSNDQTCLLCKVGSIVYSISCTPEATNLN